MSEPQELFGEIATGYAGRDRVTLGRAWHNDGLKVDGKIFAMVVREQLVIKIPAAQVAGLIEAGQGVAFEPRPGRKMREWVVLDRTDAATWRLLIADAYDFVGGG